MSRRYHLWLAAIITIYLAFGAAFALRTPRWQAPDEPAHYNYIKYLAETGHLPVLQMGDYDGPYLEQLKTLRFPPDLSIDAVRYESHQPPLYYTLATPLYLATRWLPLDARIISLRLFSVLLGALSLLVAYATVRRIFPEDSLLTLAVPAFMAAIPQRLAVTAAISNDALGELVLSALLLALIAPAPAPVIGLLLGLALLTKTNIYVALVLVPLGIWLRLGQPPAPGSASGGRKKSWPSGRAFHLFLDRLALANAVALAVAGWWFVRNALAYGGLDIFGLQRHDLVVMGQARTVPSWDALWNFLGITFRSFWVQLGWMAVPANEQTYWFLGWLSVLAILGFGAFALKAILRPGALPIEQRQSILLLAVAFFLVLLTFAQYNLRYIQPQGRYLFYAILPISVFFVLGLRELGRHPLMRAAIALTIGVSALFGLLQLRELISPRSSTLPFAVSASVLMILAVAGAREAIRARPSISAAHLILVSTYFSLLLLDLVSLFRLLPLLAGVA